MKVYGTGQYTEFRADGWPLCPRCGNDELSAHGPQGHALATSGKKEPLADWVDAIEYCLCCGWHPGAKP